MTTVHPAPHIKELRTARAWSQEQLAQIAGINVRTIQRIENGDPASFESLKCIAAAFDMDIANLLPLNRSEERDPENISGDFLLRIETGTQVVSFLPADAYHFQNDDLDSEAHVELVSSFLQELHEWGDMWDDVSPGERVRLAHDFTNRIAELEEVGLWVFAGRTQRNLSASGKSILFNVFVVQVLRSDNPMIIKVDPSKAAVFAKDAK